MLTPSQTIALHGLKNWYNGSQSYAILTGPGGVGKTFLINEFIKEINSVPLFLAPTHEALRQLKLKLQGIPQGSFKTVHSALGIVPTMTKEIMEFEHKKIPSFWGQYNLCIVDESSQIHDWILDLFLMIGIKILFVGHKSQLPPVEVKRSKNDPCISPVFQKPYRTFELTDPVRNGGELWLFTTKVEELIYNNKIYVPSTFDIQTSKVENFFKSEGKQDFLDGKAKIALWTNAGVKELNAKIRKILFGSLAGKEKYLPGDKIITTVPIFHLPFLEVLDLRGILSFMKNKREEETIYANSLATVLKCEKTTVKLSPKLEIPCFKLTVRVDGTKTIFEPLQDDAFKVINTFLEHRAWAFKDSKRKDKAYVEKHFVMSCFAKVLHFYAATCHRLQGSTIEKVIVWDKDIRKNPNPIEEKKCRYVAVSRASKELMFYRGV